MSGVTKASDEISPSGGPAAEPLIPWMGADDHAKLSAARRSKHSGQHRRRPTNGPVLAAVVVAAGLSGLATEGSATGAPIADRVLRGGLAATVAILGAACPTVVILVLSTSAAALGWTGGGLGAVAGAAALVLAVVLALTERVDRQLLKAGAAGLSMTALLRLPAGRLGMTALATGVLAGLVVVAGLHWGPRHYRRPARLVAGGLLGLAVAAGLLGAVAALQARAAFERSSTQTATALASAQSGDAAAAATAARAAAGDLELARTSLGALWARPAWAVPIVGAHLHAGHQIATSARPAVAAAAGSAESLRLDILQPEAGRLDLGRLRAAEPELSRLSEALHRAQAGAAEARSPWLIEPLVHRLDRYDAQLRSVTITADRALLAVRALPVLLGDERPTRWFVAVANPAETRDLGGFIGDYAIVTADDGRLRLERSGVVTEIGSFLPGRTLEGLDLPERYRAQHPEVFWQNLSGHPDLPTVASAARKLWQQVDPSSPIDGVAYVDPHGLAALLTLTGPVTAPQPLGRLTADNVADILHEEQYARFGDQGARKDALHEAAGAIFSAVASAPLPSPAALGTTLGRAVQGGHLLASSFDSTGQQLLDEVGATGRFPTAAGGDLASLRTANMLPNKLDTHLRRSVRYEARVDPRARHVEATATIELRNEATADLPDYVAGNQSGLPKATSRSAVTWYSALPLQGIEVDGRSVAATSFQEGGWWAHTVPVTLPPGGRATVVVRVGGRLASTRPYRLALAPQAGVHEDPYVIEVRGLRGFVADPVPPPPLGRRTLLVVPLRAG
jgi:hypothetical protein